MKQGDLVKWTCAFIAMRCATEDWKIPSKHYRIMIGVVVGEWYHGYVVQWTDGTKRTVHRDYLEVL